MKITKVRRNNDGDITNVMTNKNETLSLTQAVAFAKDGEVESVVVTKNRNGVEIIESSPKAKENERLENLPQF